MITPPPRSRFRLPLSAFAPAIARVDYIGGLAEGRLVRGHNPVLMTMELVLDRSEISWDRRRMSAADALERHVCSICSRWRCLR
jgi:hypothetical protein